MVFSSISDPYLQAALWAGLTAVGLVAGVAVSIAVMRVSARRQETRWRAFVVRWRPMLLATAMEEDSAQAPAALPRRDLRHFLRLWLYLHESIRGDAGKRLEQLAHTLGVPGGARRLLARGSRPDRLLAVLALGALRDRDGWGDLLATAQTRDPLLSVNAARALVQIDPLAAAQQLMPLLLSRQDWDASRVAAMLAGARQAFWLLLLKALPTLPIDQALAGLRLADALRLQLPVAMLTALLDPSGPRALLRAALPLAANGGTPAGLVRTLLSHPAWDVRERAVQVLAGLSGAPDSAALAACLDDGRFEVRLAAARSLAGLASVAPTGIAALVDGHPGAADVLRHAFAERNWT